MPKRTFHIYASSASEKDDWMGILKWKLVCLQCTKFTNYN